MDDNNEDNGDGDYDNSDDDVAADADTANKDKMMFSVFFTLVFATDTGISLRALYRNRTSCSAEHPWHALQHAADRIYLGNLLIRRELVAMTKKYRIAIPA